MSLKGKENNSLLIVLAFGAIYLIWGTTFMASALALKGISPFVLSCLRYFAAGLILTGWCFLRKETWPVFSVIKVLSVSGVIMLVGGSALTIYGMQYLNSGYAAVMMATEPLWFVVLDKKNWRHYFSNFKVISGLLLGFGGIAMFSVFERGTTLDNGTWDEKYLGTIILVIAAILWVIGTLYAKTKVKSESSSVTHTSIQLLAAGVFCGIIALFRQEWKCFHPIEVTYQAWGGLMFLILMGSVIAFLSFNWLVKVQPAAIVSTHTYVNPVVAIGIGCFFAGEKVSILQFAALFLVLFGVLLTQLSKGKME